MKSFPICVAMLFATWSLGGFMTAAAYASPVEDSNRLFTNFDRDNDGRLSRAEIGAYDFARYDLDGDGFLSAAEFVGGRANDRRIAAAEGNTPRAWTLLDWNHDGYLSGTELDGRWDRYDLNEDGRVTKDEFLAGSPSVPPAAPPAPAPTPFAPPAPAAPGVVPPAAPETGRSLWGKTLEQAKEADLFKFFHLGQLPDSVPLEMGTRYDFRPTAPAFRQLVLLQVLVDRETKQIKGIDALIARSFIDSPQNGVFARDFAKSVLTDFAPSAERKQIETLINEIQFGATGATVIATRPTPPLPNPPTPGYQTFLGQQQQHQQRLGTTDLLLWNHGDDEEQKLLRISIQLKPESDEPKA